VSSVFSEHPLNFDCHNDTLTGIYHPAPSDTCVIIVTGGPQYRIGSHRQFVLMARAFAHAGIAAFRFDYRGMGDSGPDAVNFDHARDDIQAAIAAVAQHAEHKSFVLLGLCDAASAILIALPQLSITPRLILINPWVHMEDSGDEARTYLKYYYQSRLLQGELWAKILRLQFNPFFSLRQFLQRLRKSFFQNRDSSSDFIRRMYKGLHYHSQDTLLLLSENDLTAKEFIEFTRRDKAWKALLADKTIESQAITQADHTFSNRHSRQQVIDYCLQWISKMPGK